LANLKSHKGTGDGVVDQPHAFVKVPSYHLFFYTSTAFSLTTYRLASVLFSTL